jgi:hypothetical protein
MCRRWLNSIGLFFVACMVINRSSVIAPYGKAFTAATLIVNGACISERFVSATRKRGVHWHPLQAEDAGRFLDDGCWN